MSDTKISLEILAQRGLDQAASGAWFAAVLDHSRDGILLLSGSGDVLLANPAAARLLGTTRASLEASSFGVTLGADEPVVLHVLGSNGEMRSIEAVARHLPVGQGTGQLVILRDVSAKIALEETNQDLRLFTHAVSHDLREPVRMMTRYLRLIEERYGDELDEDAQDFLAFARDGADRLSKMLDGLLSYARLSRADQRVEPVELEDALEAAIANLTLVVEQAGADITSDTLPTVACNHGQLVLVLQNLLSNAIRYTPEDRQPRIHVSGHPRGSMCVVTVEDNGLGIEPEELERIFDLFQQGSRTNDETAGSGMGLAICKRIVEHHGGEIWAESEPPDGSTFTFTLPLAYPEDPEEDPDQRTPEPPAR